MNKRKLLILTVISIMLAVSCGSGGGSGSGATSDSTPTGGNQYSSDSGNGSTSGSGTNNSGQQLTANDFDYYTGATYVANETTPYSRPLSPVDHLENNRFNSSGKIAINDTDRIYNPKNPDNNHSAFKGEGVAVGVFDGGFNDETNWEQINKLTNNIERVQGKGNTDTTHGYRVIKSLLQNAPSVKIYAMDVVNRITATPEYDEYKRLYDKGVRIFNNSYGNTTYIPTSVDSSLGTDTHAFLKKAINEGGALFIWSGGNEENLNRAGAFGNLPRVDPSLEKGWINVVGLMSKDYYEGNTIADVSWNNLIPLTPAGSSKYWSISALGSIDYYNYEASKKHRKTETTYGSSFAAPRVTAAAALVKQAYPFMNGDLIRQTLLSTATDIGDPGVDDVYGWGLLNIDKALKGPALFDRRLTQGKDVEIQLDGGNYGFGNNISGDAGLNLTGNGSLTLNGLTTYTGKTTVGSGAYLIVKKDSRSRMFVKDGGTVATGSQSMSIPSVQVSTNGTFVNNTNSQIQELRAENGSKIVTDVNSTIATNTAEINGEVKLTNNSGEYFTKNGRTANVITGNVTGNANISTESDLLNTKAENNTIGVQAVVSRKDVTEYAKGIGATEQEVNTAQQIETSLQGTDRQLESGTASAKTLSNAAKLQSLNKTTLDTLSGQIYASAQALTFEQQENVNRDISNRISGLGDSIESDANYSFWMDGAFSKGKIERDGFAKGKTRVNSGIAGFEAKVNDSAMVGVAIDYSKGKVKFDHYNGESKSDSVGISAYGRQNIGNAYVGGRLGYSNVDSDVKRDIIINSNDWKQSSIKHNDNVFSAYVETGYDIKKGKGFTLTPFVGASYDTVKRGSFEEENSSYGLKADKKTYSMPNAIAGLKAKQTLTRDGGLKTTFSTYASYEKGLGDKDLDFDASYVNNPSSKFRVKGINMSRSKVKVGVGVEHEVAKNVSLHLNYDLKKATDKKDTNHMITTGFKVSF